jgi:hypothetical protein
MESVWLEHVRCSNAARRPTLASCLLMKDTMGRKALPTEVKTMRRAAHNRSFMLSQTKKKLEFF